MEQIEQLEHQMYTAIEMFKQVTLQCNNANEIIPHEILKQQSKQIIQCFSNMNTIVDQMDILQVDDH